MEAMMEFFAVVGFIGSVITIVLAVYSGGKWLIGKLRNRTDSASRTTITVVNWITTGLERTVVIPYVVERVVEKVVPVIVPQSPTKPTRPRIPEWLEPERPHPHRPETPETRPHFRPRRPSWWSPEKDREPGRPYTHTRPGHPRGPRHTDAGDFFGGGSRPGPPQGGCPPQFDIREGMGGRPFGRGDDD